MLQLIHLSDTHLGPSTEYSSCGVNPYKRTLQLLEAIDELDFDPDLIVHTGDVTDDPSIEAYQTAKDVFASISHPLYFTIGNHDDAQLIKQHLPLLPHTPLVDNEDRLAYHWDMGEMRFYCLDAKVPENVGPHGEIPRDQLDALRNDISAHDLPYAVFLHFPPFHMGSEWMDDKLILTNGQNLHDILVESSPDRHRIRGVFFGHTHRSIQLYREGILYSGIASPIFQFSMTPQDGPPTINPDSPLIFSHVTFLPNSTVVKEYTINP